MYDSHSILQPREPKFKPQVENKNCYFVGVGTDGRTALRLNDESGFSTTLYIGPKDVIQLIRLLEATLSKETDS
jgi:hypothetical protein